MIIFGSPNVILPIINRYNNYYDFTIFNLSSNIVDNSIKRLNIQYMQGIDFSQKDTDIIYANNIIQNDMYFVEFMQIIIALKGGRNVAILVYREEDLFDPFTETLAKLIQQRYGYNYQILNCVEDFNEWDDSNFDINGIFMADRDTDRYISIISQINPKVFTDEIINDSHF